MKWGEKIYKLSLVILVRTVLLEWWEFLAVGQEENEKWEIQWVWFIPSNVKTSADSVERPVKSVPNKEKSIPIQEKELINCWSKVSRD